MGSVNVVLSGLRKSRNLSRWGLVLFLLCAWSGGRSAVAAERVLYETRFEIAESFDPALTLVGQSGWIGFGSGGNGLVEDFFAGQGQHAFIGFAAPTNSSEFLNVWRPVGYVPGPTNPPTVRFSVLMSIEDSSSTTNRDDFRWSIYNQRGDRLFTVDFDNHSLGINYLLDNGTFVPTGLSFSNSVAYPLQISMDFTANRWSATLGATTVATNLAITTRGVPLDFGDADAVWAIRKPGSPGDNFMVFDNYRVVADAGGTGHPAPRLEAVAYVKEPKGFLIRGQGTPGVRYVLESTADWGTWVPLTTNTMPAEGSFPHLDTGGAGVRFYRLVER